MLREILFSTKAFPLMFTLPDAIVHAGDPLDVPQVVTEEQMDYEPPYGGQLVGYLTATVIDGIVIAATGQSGAEWVAASIKAVLNKPYSSTVTIPKETVCMGYPMYGWKPEYCR